MNLDGRIAIVTGATKGVGRGVARALAQQGARVFATGRSMPDGPVDQRITGLRCDHRDDAQVDAAFARILAEASTIDVLSVAAFETPYATMTADMAKELKPHGVTVVSLYPGLVRRKR